MVKFFRTLVVSALAVLAFGGAGMALGTALAGEAEAATASVAIYTQKGFKGSVVKVEAMRDNAGWCIPVGKSLPGDVGRSIKNGSSTYIVKAYAGSRCDRGGFNVQPGSQRTGVMGGAVYIRSIKLVRK